MALQMRYSAPRPLRQYAGAVDVSREPAACMTHKRSQVQVLHGPVLVLGASTLFCRGLRHFYGPESAGRHKRGGPHSPQNALHIRYSRVVGSRVAPGVRTAGDAGISYPLPPRQHRPSMPSPVLTGRGRFLHTETRRHSGRLRFGRRRAPTCPAAALSPCGPSPVKKRIPVWRRSFSPCLSSFSSLNALTLAGVGAVCNG